MSNADSSDSQESRGSSLSPSLLPSNDSTTTSEASGVSGKQLIFRLFVALAIATAVSLLVFAQMVDEGRPRNRVYIALVGNLLLPVVAWFILKAIARRQARKSQVRP